jgi:hypothetical protein
MHYYLYEIKNTVNGKIYVGVHKTKLLDDGYMGSGKVIANAIRKYGIEHFTKTILETFDNPADMFAKEKEVVNDEFLTRTDVYNLRRGGTGGFDYVNTLKTDIERTRVGKLGQQAIRDKKLNKYAIDYVSPFADKELQEKLLARAITPAAVAKRKETYKQIRHSQGQSNSQFGTCWMFCDWIEKNIKIKRELIPYYLDQGWSKGRKNMG